VQIWHSSELVLKRHFFAFSQSKKSLRCCKSTFCLFSLLLSESGVRHLFSPSLAASVFCIAFMVQVQYLPVLRIWIRIRIYMFLGLLDPDPDPFVRCHSNSYPTSGIKIQDPQHCTVSVVGKWKHRVRAGGRVLHPPHPPAPRQPAPGYSHHPPPPRSPLPPGSLEFRSASLPKKKQSLKNCFIIVKIHSAFD
jgi:hypothetical protein